MIPLYELIGYVASFFVAISLVMSSLLALRILNLIGAISFVIYGVWVGATPIVITNAFITLVDIWYLVRMVRPDDSQVVYVPVGVERRAQLLEFLAHHGSDITRYFPDFGAETIDEVLDAGGRAYLALDDLRIAGFALVRPVPSGEARHLAAEPLRSLLESAAGSLFPERSAVVMIDYVTVRYRGLGLVHRLYAAIEHDARGGLSFLLAPVARAAKGHRRFLAEQGFRPHVETDGHELMVKTLQG